MKNVFKIMLAAWVCLGVLSVQAEDKPAFKDWLKKLQARIGKTEEKYKGRITATAAVRGDKQDGADAKKLYWKGKKEAKPVTAEEIEDFKAALALAEGGKTDDAKKSFTAFLEKYPQSAMAADAKETLAYLDDGAAGVPGVETPSTMQ